MSYAAHRKDLVSLVSEQIGGKSAADAKEPGILRRIFDRLIAFRQGDADRQIARFVAARSGGVLTDELEREIAQRLSTSNWNVNAFTQRRFP